MAKCFRTDTEQYQVMEDLNFTNEEISQIELKLQQLKFLEWYGKGKVDSYGWASLHDKLYFVNDKGEKITIINLKNDEYFVKREHYKADLTYLDKINSFLEEEQVALLKRISKYRNTPYGERLKRLMNDLITYDANEYLTALNKHTEYIYDSLAIFEAKFRTHDLFDKTKASKKDLQIRDENYKELLLNVSNFLYSFEKINSLELPLDKGAEGQKILVKLKEAQERVSTLKNKVNNEIETLVRDTLIQYISNPEVKKGTLDFLAAQTDESKVQLMLDALGDSHVTFLASIDKFFKRAMFDKDEEVKQRLREWDKLVNSVEGGFDNFLERVLEKDENGQKTGKFIQEFKEDYYDELFTQVNALKSIDKKSPEYKFALENFYQWKQKNTEQEFVQEYYDALNLLIPEAREAKEKIDILRKDILAKGADKLTTEDYERLEELTNEMKALKSSYDASGKKKTDIDLQISLSLNKYSKEFNKFFSVVNVNMLGFNRAKAKAKEEGTLEEFEKNNTREEFTKEFWDSFNDLMGTRSSAIQDVSDQINAILIKYKNEKGEVKVDEIPANIRTEIKKLETKKAALSKKESLNLSPSEKAERAYAFNDLVKFIPTSEYIKKLAEMKKGLADKTISKEEYNKWVFENHNKNEYTDITSPISIWTKMRPVRKSQIKVVPNSKWETSKVDPQYLNRKYKEDASGYAVPKEQWKNVDYANLSETDLTNLNKVKDLLLYLTDHSKKDIIKRNGLPAIASNEKTNIEATFGKKRKPKKSFDEKAITETDEIVQFIPFNFIKSLNQKPLPKLGSGTTEAENKAIEEERKKIIAENKKAHAEAINYDLKNTMKVFIEAALKSKYKNKIENDLLLFKEQIKQMKVLKTDAKGNKIIDKFKSEIKGEKTVHEASAIGSNMEEHFAQWMEGVFYEEWEFDEGLLTTITDKLINFSSLRALGFNVLSTLNNKIVGNIQTIIESSGGVHFSTKDYAKARKTYFSNIISYVGNYNKKTSDNYLDGFIKHFDILVSQDELAQNPNGTYQTLLHKAAMVKDAAYFGMHLGEHQVQNTSLISMAYSHRIVNGKILNFSEFFENKKVKIEYNPNMSEAEKQEVDKNIEINKSLEESARIEFENYPSLFDSFEMDADGYLKKKDNIEIEDSQIFDFKQRVIGINQRMHGIYNVEDAAILQRNALGRLGMQFRKWMRPSFIKRFGKEFGKQSYNERIREYDEGMYITTMKFVGQPFKLTYKKYKEQQANTSEAAFRALTEGFSLFIRDSKIRWHSLSDTERANVKKTATEMLFLISVIALGYTVKNLKGDDDDIFLTWVLYQADRLFGELSVFNVGIVREGNRLFKSPSPTFSTIEDVGKLMTAVALYPIRDKEERIFKSGIYHGEDKISIYAKDLVPFYTQVQKLKYLNANSQRYGMFR